MQWRVEFLEIMNMLSVTVRGMATLKSIRWRRIARPGQMTRLLLNQNRGQRQSKLEERTFPSVVPPSRIPTFAICGSEVLIWVVVGKVFRPTPALIGDALV